MSEARRRAYVAGTAIALALATVAAASSIALAASPQSSQSDKWIAVDGFVSSHDLPEIWAAETESFPGVLPGDQDWPKAPPALPGADNVSASSFSKDVPGATEEDVLIEDGLPAVLTSYYWLCAWEGEALSASARGDVETTLLAIRQIEGFLDLPAIENVLVGAEDWEKQVLVPAQNGDLSGVEGEYESGTCNPGMPNGEAK